MKSRSFFAENGFTSAVDALLDEIRRLYRADHVPWVVGYSGGKDSTAVLQLIWLAVSQLPEDQRAKPIHVISTDTLVENPIVAAWVGRSLDKMKEMAYLGRLPFRPHRLTPEAQNSFWVNLIGRGYPAPRPKFRWCTERLKIRPSNAFINRIVSQHSEAILVLGTRKAESQARAKAMTSHEKYRVRDRLSPNAALPGSLVYTPIEDWSNDDVWMFLMQKQNPWGYNNKELLTMYQGASPDGECPLVVDSSTPSCGDSRFGCWVCTLVDKDKSMTAMIQNDQEKEWMMPLLALRNELDVTDDRHLRDFRRMSGSVQLFHDRPIPGPYTQESREQWLTKLLQAQRWIREHGPADVRKIDLITLPELEEIRRIWVLEKHELEDSLPRLYQQIMGELYPGKSLEDNAVLGAQEISILREICGHDKLHFELTRELLDVERKHRSMSRRAGLYDSLEEAFKRSFFVDESDATRRARLIQSANQAAKEGNALELSFSFMSETGKEPDTHES
jgi:DNA sulfur modification protein DndC